MNFVCGHVKITSFVVSVDSTGLGQPYDVGDKGKSLMVKAFS